MPAVLNNPAPGGRTRSGSDRVCTGSNAPRSTSPHARSSRIGTTPTPSELRQPACRRSTTAARAASACRVSSTSCILMKGTTAQPELTAGSATEFSTYRPSWFVTLCPVARCRLSPIPFSSWYRRPDSSPPCLRSAEIAVAVADGLVSLSGHPDRRKAAIDTRAVELARDYLAAHSREQTSASILEKIAGTDRFTIARHFRWAFGTSPDRYRTLRRLALARAAIESGQSLARAASEAGFADQSHMTRQFKRTYGLTPGRWMALTTDSSRETARESGAGSQPRARTRSREADLRKERLVGSAP